MKKAKEAAVQYRTNTSISLSPDLMEQLRQAAEWKGVTLEEAMQQAVLSYFYERYAREKIEQEQILFEKMHPQLLQKYRDEYVAVHNGKVVAHAKDLSTLRKKVFVRFGHTPILHTQVTQEPLPDIVIRSPRLERP